MDTSAQDIPRLETIYTIEDIIKQVEASGVNLGNDPARRLNTFVDNGLLPQPKNGRFASFVVQRIIAIQNKLQEGKSISELKEEVSKERRRFLNQVTDLTSMAKLYHKFSSNSLFFLASLLLVAMVSIGILGAGLTGSSNPVIVAGESIVKAVIETGTQVAKTAAKPLGNTIVTIIKTAKPEDSDSADPLGLTNLEEKEFVIPENIVLLNEGGNIELDGSVTANNFFGDLLWSSVIERPKVLSSIDSVENDGGNIDLIAGSGITILSDNNADTITFSSIDNSSSQFIFKNISVSGQSNIAADLNNDTLTLVAGSNVSLTTNPTTDSLTIGVIGTVSNADTLDLLDSTAFLKVAGGTMAGGLILNSTETLSPLNISSGSRVLNTLTFNPSGGGTQYGHNLNITNAPTFTANTAIGYNVTIADTSTSINQVYGFYADTSHFGTTSGGFVNTYGGYFKVRGDTGANSKSIGLYTDAQGSDLNYGVWANGTDYGVYAVGNKGVYGFSQGPFATYGVHGRGAAGVFGESNGSGWVYGVFGQGTGAITAGPVFAGYFKNTATSSTAALSRYGVYAQATGTWNGAGANNYALYVEDPTGGTNNYGIYQNGTTGTNVLNANTRIGSTAAPTVALDVTGDFNLSGDITAGSATSTHTLNGMVCIRNATACPVQGAGRLYVDTAGTAGDDPGDVFDIAEIFPATEPIAQGEIVSIAGNRDVKKSSGAYDPKILGVTSTHPAILIDEGRFAVGINKNEYNPNRPWVALAGRVPVKVSTENGNISPGDPLTSSSTPGVAMKATKSGPTIGKALVGYDGSGVGSIMTFVSTGWYVAPLNDSDDFVADLSAITDLDVATLTATIVTAEIIKTDELQVSDETSGNDEIKAGQKSVTIENGRVKEDSKILVTFTSDYSPANRYWITKEKGKSFSVHLDQPAARNSIFSWLIIN